MQQLLLIEDNADNRELIHAFLDGEFEVQSVEDGPSALAVLEDEAGVHLDVVLCDIALPGMDGVEVLQRLRRIERVDYLPVIAVTSHAMAGDRERFLDAGFDAYLSKPIHDPEALFSAIADGMAAALRRN
jgi:CheY-like chemotaxis protein